MCYQKYTPLVERLFRLFFFDLDSCNIFDTAASKKHQVLNAAVTM